MKSRRIAFVLVLFVCLSTGAYSAYKFYNNSQKAGQKLEQRKLSWKRLAEAMEQERENFSAETAFVIKDLDLGWGITRHKDKLIPAASLVKIPIMAACFYAAEHGKLNLKDKLRLSESFKVGGSGVLKGMPAGSVWSIEKLIELMIAYSDNTAANMLIDLLGFDYLNSSFQELGLVRTNLARKMMDFKRRGQGVENYTTAEDMAYILENIYRQKLLNKEISQGCLELLKRQKVNDRIPAKLPAGVAVAHKTGLERNVCHDAGIVFTQEGDFLVCVLTMGKSSKKAKQFISSATLLTYNFYQ